MQSPIEKIKLFADQAHGEQLRKYTPERYIVHPIRVMKTCEQYTSDITILAAALLHDVLEDTDVSADEMLSFLETVVTAAQANGIVELVQELTDVYTKKN